eukprot:sb/3475696/
MNCQLLRSIIHRIAFETDVWAWQNQDISRDRLLGTTVLLVGSTSTTTCGSIETTNQDATSVQDQSYTIPCSHDAERTISVRLENNGQLTGGQIVMQIAEVTVLAIIVFKFKFTHNLSQSHTINI